MSGGTINVPMVFRGPNGAAAGVAAQHSQVIFLSFILSGISSDYCRQFGKGLQNSQKYAMKLSENLKIQHLSSMVFILDHYSFIGP